MQVMSCQRSQSSVICCFFPCVHWCPQISSIALCKLVYRVDRHEAEAAPSQTVMITFLHPIYSIQIIVYLSYSMLHTNINAIFGRWKVYLLENVSQWIHRGYSHPSSLPLLSQDMEHSAPGLVLGGIWCMQWPQQAQRLYLSEFIEKEKKRRR